MATFNLQIVTPDKLFYNEDVDMLVVRTTEGDVGILKGHIDYVASLDIGIIKIKKDGVFKEATIAGGFIQVDKEKTTILTEAAEWPVEIDVERAKKAKELAESIINRKLSDREMDMAEVRLKKALNRIRTAQKD
ncbi:ATP synthase F1 subunit epsilon [Acetoanaerobium noterae]|jgi:F-type H+-transporting ATPase subunit epsilon|uniref:ATP synthase F1 subunit epsilon n=1 Tax=Acetoanaerobium noterae TaxID=745369 RepID=UPI001B7CA361|nr:ATP synthase F1 subunit epsilon [Acetoanaerobium noterae]MBP8762719.1 ATP synthase F1 subunit epsilon [Acetoanaerobium sp.]MBP9499743.1 ATP synthase F1 subunit epsilon [Acetoanaerobium sp.]MBP9561883.1 ATP synthase F1 subunit epsilon [Acetoanaerobium sp.]MDK2804215.1 F-type H+-transporting ATPase subunit epsilon [Peptostreptococcaceae bacterium]